MRSSMQFMSREVRLPIQVFIYVWDVARRPHLFLLIHFPRKTTISMKRAKEKFDGGSLCGVKIGDGRRTPLKHS